MAKGGNVVFEFLAETKDLDSAISSISGGIGKMATKAGKALTVGITTPLVGLGTKALKTAVDFVKLKESSMGVFEQMLGGADAAEEMYQSLLAVAKASTYSQEAFLTAGKTLVGMGTNAKDTTKYLQAITNAVAGFGGSSADIESLATVFGKVSAKGKVLTDDLNMLAERGVNGLQILASHFNVTTDEMQGMVSDGMVPAKEGLDILVNGMENGYTYAGQFHQGMAGMAQSLKNGTLTGALDGLNSSFRNFSLGLTNAFENKQYMIDLVNEFGKALGNLPTLFSGVTDGIAPFLKGLTDILQKFNEMASTEEGRAQLQKIGDTILKLAGAGPILLAVGKGFNIFSDISGKVSSTSTTLSNFVEGIKGVSKNSAILTKVLSSGLGFAGLTAIALLALGGLDSAFGETITNLCNTAIEKGPEIITNFVNGIVSKIPELMKRGAELVSTLTQAISANLPYIISGAVQIILALAQGLIDNLPTIISAGLELITQLAFGLIASLPILIDKIPDIISSLVIALLDPSMLAQILKCGLELLMALALGIGTAIPQLIDTVPRIIKEIKEKLGQKIKETDWKKLGRSILDGLINGFLNFGNIIKNAIKKFGNSIVKGAKDFFGIHSPSILMEKAIGKFLPQGIAVGITANADSALKAIDSLNKNMYKSFDVPIPTENLMNSIFNLSPQFNPSQTMSFSSNVIVNNNVSFEQDALGQMVNKTKTFSGGSKNDFNFGVGG